MDENTKNWMSDIAQFEPDVFWERYRQKIVGTTAVVVIVGVAAFWWQRQRQEDESMVVSQLASARDIASLQHFTKQNGSQPLGAVAWLRLGDLCFEQGKYAEAADAYQKLIAFHPRSLLADGARLGAAAVQEAQGNLEAAKASYAQLAGNPASYAAVPARMGLARCAEIAGQSKEAKQLYEEVLAAGPNSLWQSPAVLRWTVLSRGQATVPSVAGTEGAAGKTPEVVFPQPVSR